MANPVILADHETKFDLLNTEAIAKTIVDLLRGRPEHPVTVGVHGDWGAGKSSVLEMIEAGFNGNDKVLCLKFNGWRFQGFEDAKIALIEGIVTGLLAKRPMLTKGLAAVKDVFARIDYLKAAKKIGGLALTAYTGIPTADQISSIVGTLEAVITDPTQILSKDNVTHAIDGVKSILRPSHSQNVPEEVEGFRKAFDKLLKEAHIEQLIVLIDDLDRCLPDTAIETLEAIRLFVFTSRTAFVIAADEAMIEYAVRKHFPDLPESTGPRDYARNYLEKLIQIPFRIPALGETETRIYVTLLLAGAQLGEEDAHYAKLVEMARERMRRPWESAPLDGAAVKSVLGEKANSTHNALFLSDQIGPILAAGTRGNPGQIKRFLNTLLLRERMASARGFGADISLPVLAKLMLAERFLPRVFEQIASSAASNPKGLCPEIADLEASVAPDPTAPAPAPPRDAATEPRGSIDPAPSVDSLTLTEWKASETTRDWARVRPPLAPVDLRPYLFVTKDKKDYFGPASVLGHLATVVEKLFGPKFSVQAYEGELKQLVQAEAEKVFDAVRGMVGGAFDTQPPGIDGLVTLVKAQPGLQTKLLDFLESLPPTKCGPWVVRGWQGIVKDGESVARFRHLLGDWSGATNNPMLKAAAEAVISEAKARR
jgi:hypothetical protein